MLQLETKFDNIHIIKPYPNILFVEENSISSNIGHL
jgi:hypothetical protein